MLVGKELDTGLERRLAALEPTDLRALPDDPSVRRECNRLVRSAGQRVGPGGELRGEDLGGGVTRRLAVDAVARNVGREAETVETADIVVLDQDLTVRADLGHHFLLVAQPPHENAGTPVDKTLCQTFMKRIGQIVLDRPGAVLPVLGIVQPLRAVRHEGPGTNLREPVRQRIEVAVGAVGLGHLIGEPVFGDLALFAHDETVERGDQLRVAHRRDLPVVGDLAHLPKEADRRRRAGDVAERLVARHVLERDHVVDHARTGQPRMVGRLAQALLQGLDGGEVLGAASPLQDTDLVESVTLEPVDQLRVERRHLSGHAERAVIHVAAGAARDLADFRRGQIAMGLAVELAHARERHMIEIEIKTHADGVGRHEEIDIAVLIELDLRIPSARAQGPEHDRRAAALAPHQFGDGIDVARREGDDGGAAG